jgi:hypothetical protein
VNSGKRLVFIAALSGAGLVLGATDAHAPASTTGGMLVAAEFTAAAPLQVVRECALTTPDERMELRFEIITDEPDPDEVRRLVSRAGQGSVGYAWNPDTGELEYGARPVFTLPAMPGASASPPSTASCESR